MVISMDIGSVGLQEVNLIIPQNTSLAFDIVHTDEDGTVIDHSQSDIHMVAVMKDKTNYDMSRWCSGEAERIRVTIPRSISDDVSIGKYPWDMIVDTVNGDSIRVAYGKLIVVDTYALD